MPTRPISRSARAVMLSALTAAAFATYAPFTHAGSELTKVKYDEAASLIYRSTSLIFSCMSSEKGEKPKGKDGKPTNASYKLAYDTMALLDKARSAIDSLGAWDRDSFEVPEDDLVTKGLVEAIAKDLKIEPKEFRAEHVRKYTIHAIGQMMDIIGKWSDCSAPFRTNRDYVEFIRAKVQLERATQLSEIQYVPKPKR